MNKHTCGKIPLTASMSDENPSDVTQIFIDDVMFQFYSGYI